MNKVTVEPYSGVINTAIMTLLLAADPNQEIVETYLGDAEILLALDGNEPIGISVLVQAFGQHELKNLSVSPAYQGEGIAKVLIEHTKQLARSAGGESLLVATGNSSLDQLALYQKCGFRMDSITQGFFADYHPKIFENGIRCIDLVVLKAKL